MTGWHAHNAAASDNLVEIVAPAKGERFNCFPVEVRLDVDFETLHEAKQPPASRLRLNRKDVTDQLEPTDTGFRILVSPEEGLRVASAPGAPRSAGLNSLVSLTKGPTGRVERDTRHFVVRLDNDQPPTADAGPDQAAFVGETVQLDGTASSDPTCSAALRHQWRFVETPEDSAAELSQADTAQPSFEPDVPGTYVVELVVSNDAAESEADAVSVVIDTIEALAIGSLQSPVLDALAKTVQPVAYDGTQDLAAFDLLVVDGDAHSPAELSANDQVNEAFHLGKHILAVDLTEAHKSDWLFGLTNFASEGATDGALVQQGKDQSGYPIIRIAEVLPPDARQRELNDAAPDFEDDFDPELDQQGQVDTFAGNVLDALRDPSGRDGEVSDNPIPPDLIHVTWVYPMDVPWTQTQTGKGRTGLQGGSNTTNYTLTLMLDNFSSPQGNSQFLVAQADGEMTPTSAGGGFLSWQLDERAWFQDQMVVTLEPQDQGWNWVASGPQTPNNETQYNNSLAFQVGFAQDSGGNANFQWTSGQSFTISDWAVAALGAQTQQIWNWRSQQPGNTDAALNNAPGYAIAGWFSLPEPRHDGYPRTPMSSAKHRCSITRRWRGKLAACERTLPPSSSPQNSTPSIFGAATISLPTYVTEGWTTNTWVRGLNRLQASTSPP
jgi:hypothetical protein